MGDCALTRNNEEKTIIPLKECAHICANNILYSQKLVKKILQIPLKFDFVYSITLGPDLGILIKNNYCKITPKAAEEKIRLRDAYLGILKNQPTGFKSMKKEMKKMHGCEMGCCGKCLCLPCAKQPVTMKDR